tara:strand:+ start:229 stop:462 length:234 start_codon:yes stop_codon:yes gene_type:complete
MTTGRTEFSLWLVMIIVTIIAAWFYCQLAERLSDLEDKYQMAVNFVLLEDGINRININDRRIQYLETLIESEFKATK